MITKEDKILIKNLWESKNYGAKRLISEFPKKKWSRRGLQDFLRRLRMTGSIEHTSGSGRPRMVCTAQNVHAVEELIQSQEDRPQVTSFHSSNFQRTWNFAHNCQVYHSQRSVSEMS